MQNAVYSQPERGQPHMVDLEVPCQNAFKDKPAFIKRLIKVLAAQNLFLVRT